ERRRAACSCLIACLQLSDNIRSAHEPTLPQGAGSNCRTVLVSGASALDQRSRRFSMTLRAGREFLSIPGPTVIPDAVLAAMQKPAVEIYSGPLVALTASLLADMSKIFRTEGRSYIYAANGHGAWEAALTNVLSRGDKVLVLESGRFAIGWGEAAKMLGAEVEIFPGDFRRAVRPEAVEARLKQDTKGEIKAILVAQIDTASGVVNDIKAIGAAIRAAGHDALLMVDTVASLGCVPFEMDAW